MPYKIIVTESAKEDTQTAYNYYEDQKQDLGEEFLQELVNKYDNLGQHPEHYGYIDKKGLLRDLKIDRFPYVIIFEVTADSVIVYAVHNTYRHPKRMLVK